MVNHDVIARGAYYKWLQAGRPTGRDLEFWYAAEDELRMPASAREQDVHTAPLVISGNTFGEIQVRKVGPTKRVRGRKLTNIEESSRRRAERDICSS